VPSRMVSVSASVNFPLHHKVQKFSSGIGGCGVVWLIGLSLGMQASIFGACSKPG